MRSSFSHKKKERQRKSCQCPLKMSMSLILQFSQSHACVMWPCFCAARQMKEQICIFFYNSVFLRRELWLKCIDLWLSTLTCPCGSPWNHRAPSVTAVAARGQDERRLLKYEMQKLNLLCSCILKRLHIKYTKEVYLEQLGRYMQLLLHHAAT